MKRIIFFAFAALPFAACNEQKTSETSTEMTDTAGTTTVMPDPMPATPTTTMPDTPMNSATTSTTTTTTTYVAGEGDVTYRNGKVMVWRKNAWVDADDDINQDDGIVVKKNGEVTRDGKVVKLNEGETVSKTGKFFNKAGEGIEDGWSATKKGVGKAAQAVKKGVKKAGEGIKDAVD